MATKSSNEKKPRIDLAHCPMCSHTVEAEVIWNGKRWIVKPGQNCGRCHSPLDAGYVLYGHRAA